MPFRRQVVSAGPAGSAGNLVVIDHGAGESTRYLHLARITATVGQQVQAGQQVGVEGSTGLSLGPHLHFEVLRNGTPVDPIPWLQRNGAAPVPTVLRTYYVGPNSSTSAGSTSTSSANSSTAAAQIGAYRGDQLQHAATIIRTGQQLGADDWTVTVAVMTAMRESSLHNLDHGDAAGPDSRGLFQQRTHWGPEATRMNPGSAVALFYRAVLAVPGYRQLSPTQLAHRVQGNDDSNAYTANWNDAVQVVAELTKNPGLLQTLADAVAPVCDPAQAGNLPPGPGGRDCPPTGLPAEGGLHAPRCIATAFPELKNYGGVGDRAGNPGSDHPHGDAVDIMIPVPAAARRGRDLRSADAAARRDLPDRDHALGHHHPDPTGPGRPIVRQRRGCAAPPLSDRQPA